VASLFHENSLSNPARPFRVPPYGRTEWANSAADPV
jgi:hypothetical protein